MKKSNFILLAALLLCSLGMMATPYKNLYVTADVYPAGAGEVYITATSNGLVTKETGYGENSECWLTVGENGQDSQQGIGAFEAMLYAKPNTNYKFIGFAKELKEDGEYSSSDLLTAFEGDTEYNRQYVTANYSGSKVNVNNVNHAEDGNSDNGDDLASVAAKANWSETPDFHAYAIFESTLKNVISTEENRIGSKGDTITVNLALDNANDITAFQFDITTGAGIKVLKNADTEEYEVALTDRKADQVLHCRKTGAYVRVLSYSTTETSLNGHEGTLVTVKFCITSSTTTHTANIKSIMLTDARGAEFTSPDINITFSNEASGIKSNYDITLGESAENVYNVNGQLIQKGTNDLKERNIYIVRGKKFTK